MINWTKGFSSRYYMTIVDRDTWRDGKRLELTGGSIKRSPNDLRHSADLDAVNFTETGETLIRVWLDASQGNATDHTPLFTGYATTPGRNIDGRLVTNSLQCYSVLKPAADVLLPRGWYAPAEMNAVNQIQQLLKVTKAPVRILGDTSDLTKIKLKTAVVAEANETNLSMAELLLSSINWRMTLEGDGTICLDNQAKTQLAVFDSIQHDILEPTISDDYDWFNCPNVFRAVMDNSYALAKDEDKNSPFSIQNRGREIWVEETSCNLNANETLAEYARRRLKELQIVSRTISYKRRFDPRITVSDIVRLNYPAQDIVGDFVVTSQGIDLGFGATTSEEVMRNYGNGSR